MKGTVLVGVLKSKEDLRILLEEKWYRIPLAFLPKRKFTHIAFYQPELFGHLGKRIAYYAKVAKREISPRIELLPKELSHERANAEYLRCSFRKIAKLKQPIRNIIPRRVSFGFTDLKTLRQANDILELYHVPPTEQLIEAELRRLRIPFTSQLPVRAFLLTRGAPPPACRDVCGAGRSSAGKGVRRYRLDFAIFCKRGNIAIECDNRKAHSGALQKLKDKAKDAALRRLGWRVVRLTEKDILENTDACLTSIQTAMYLLGGIK